MRRSRRSRSSGRERAIQEYFDTQGMEAEPLAEGPDEAFPLRPFAEGNTDRDELPEVPVTDEGPDPARLLRRARRTSRSGRRSDAIQAYRDLLEVARDNIEGRLELARLLEDADDIAGALGQLDCAVADAPQRADVITARGALHARLKHYHPAEADLAEALRLDPGHAPAHFHSGMVQLRRGRDQQAAASFRRTLECTDQIPDALYYLGEALNLLDDFDGAITTVERAIDVQPDDPRGYRLLGRVLDRCGRPEDAQVMYQKAREVARR